MCVQFDVIFFRQSRPRSNNTGADSYNLCGSKKSICNSLWLSDATWCRKTVLSLVKWWSVAFSSPSYYLNQCWLIINRTHRDKRVWYFNQNALAYLKENTFDNALFKTTDVFLRYSCVNMFVYGRVLWGGSTVNGDTHGCNTQPQVSLNVGVISFLWV